MDYQGTVAKISLLILSELKWINHYLTMGFLVISGGIEVN